MLKAISTRSQLKVNRTRPRQFLYTKMNPFGYQYLLAKRRGIILRAMFSHHQKKRRPRNVSFKNNMGFKNFHSGFTPFFPLDFPSASEAIVPEPLGKACPQTAKLIFAVVSCNKFTLSFSFYDALSFACLPSFDNSSATATHASAFLSR